MWTLRPATNSDGPAIGALYKDCEHPDHGAHWYTANVEGWWVVATATDDPDGPLLGAIQFCASQPCGWIGDILVHPYARTAPRHGFAKSNKGSLTHDLYYTAMGLLAAQGSEFVIGTVMDERVLKMLKVHGTVDLGATHLVIRRLC